MKRLFSAGRKKVYDPGYEPEVTLFVAAYNEKDYVDKKVQNSLELEYPREKVRQVWVTDGSDDGTPEMLKKYRDQGVEVYHKDERAGKIAAMNRGVDFVKSPVVIFSDGNTMLGKESIRRIVNLFSNPKVGCVSGEKRIYSKDKDTAAGTEGIYWKYESTLKKWDAELYSVVGAAGELFAVRTDLFEHVEGDTLLDDFIVSLRIAMKGYTIQYDPEAYAIEAPSANVKEELKRKIRISAGGIQSILRLLPLLNIFQYGTLSFQYISHRVLRWTLAPLFLLLILLINTIITASEGFFDFSKLFTWLFWGQVVFYMMALIGWYLENHKIKIKALFIPYYFFIMNLSVYLGLRRFLKGKQSVNWERAKEALNQKETMAKRYIIILFLIFANLEFAYSCQHEYDASTGVIDGSNILPGDTLCLLGGNWSHLLIRNIEGTAQMPVLITNKSGAVIINTDWFYGMKLSNCSYVKISGAGQEQFKYGIVIQSVTNEYGAGMSIDAMSTDVEVEFLEISNTGIGGIYAKTEPDYSGDCSFPAVREKFTMFNTIIHDCYLHDIGDEGFYIGSSKYTGQTVYHCNDTIVLPHLMIGVKIYNNILENIGWDGIQVGSAVEDCHIFNNIVIRDSQKEEANQMSGIIIGGGSACDCYNNKIADGKGDGIDFLGLKGVNIYNNLIIRPGFNFHNEEPPDQFQKHGIWIGDLETQANQEISIYNNTIVSPRTFGVKLANTSFTDNILTNNIIVNPGAFQILGENAYINRHSPLIPLSESHNFLNPDTATARFVGPLQANYDLHYFSPAVNAGADLSSLGLQNDYLHRLRPFDGEYDIGAFECHDSTLFGVQSHIPEIKGHGIHPNPAGDIAIISIRLEKASYLKLELLDIHGKMLKRVFEGKLESGTNQFRINLPDIKSGLYLYRISNQNNSYTSRFIKN
ncbi:MAG: glycosyltransferase [Bacteroidota bacterium]|nr:glycosyltransferase [Bacteroidota bacterium]